MTAARKTMTATTMAAGKEIESAPGEPGSPYRTAIAMEGNER